MTFFFLTALRASKSNFQCLMHMISSFLAKGLYNKTALVCMHIQTKATKTNKLLSTASSTRDYSKCAKEMVCACKM